MAREITGRKFFLIFAAFFIVIISVNMILAVSAVKTFPGLETDSSYIRNQTFDIDRASQEALGWTVVADVVDEELHVAITDDTGAPVEVAEISGIFGRATTVRDDQTPEFVFDGARYVAPVTSGLGNWNLRMTAVAKDGTKFEQRVIVLVER